MDKDNDRVQKVVNDLRSGKITQVNAIDQHGKLYTKEIKSDEEARKFLLTATILIDPETQELIALNSIFKNAKVKYQNPDGTITEKKASLFLNASTRKEIEEVKKHKYAYQSRSGLTQAKAHQTSHENNATKSISQMVFVQIDKYYHDRHKFKCKPKSKKRKESLSVRFEKLMAQLEEIKNQRSNELQVHTHEKNSNDQNKVDILTAIESGMNVIDGVLIGEGTLIVDLQNYRNGAVINGFLCDKHSNRNQLYSTENDKIKVGIEKYITLKRRQLQNEENLGIEIKEIAFEVIKLINTFIPQVHEYVNLYVSTPINEQMLEVYETIKKIISKEFIQVEACKDDGSISLTDLKSIENLINENEYYLIRDGNLSTDLFNYKEGKIINEFINNRNIRRDKLLRIEHCEIRDGIEKYLILKKLQYQVAKDICDHDLNDEIDKFSLEVIQKIDTFIKQVNKYLTLYVSTPLNEQLLEQYEMLKDLISQELTN